MDAALASRWLLVPAVGPRTGLGHLRRCAALETAAPAAIAQAEASLLGAEERHRLWATLIPEQHVTWIILDGYMFTADDHRALQATGRQLLVIDDGHHLDNYQADLIVNPNVGSESLIYRGSPLGRRLQGADYAIISPAVVKLRDLTRDTPQVARRLIVTTGGGDPGGIRELLLPALEAVEHESLDITVIVGPWSNGAEVQPPAASRHRWTFVRDPENLAELMNQAELAISTAGVTLSELACLGVPTIALIAADNQEPGAVAFARSGAVELAGKLAQITVAKLAQLIERLSVDRGRRQQLTENAQRLIDGQGVQRIARAIDDLTIHLRRATLADLALLFTWVNDPTVRQASFHSEPISLQEHTQWFHARLSDSASTIYLACNAAGEPWGLARFEHDGEQAVMSVSVAREYRGKRRGTRLIDLAVRRYRFEHAKSAIVAQIKRSNEASYRAFRRAGFTFVGETQLHGQPASLLVLR